MVGKAELLLRARQDAGMTQHDLARLTQIQQPRLSQYETGSVRPSESTVARILCEMDVRPSLRLEVAQDEVTRLARDHGARRVWVFGSCADGTDTSESDVDLLIEFAPGTSTFDIVHLIEELQELLGVPVDVVTTNTRTGQKIMCDAVEL